MVRIILIRPGSTDFDEQGRITGTLDIPLNEQGTRQVVSTAKQLSELPIEIIYTSPSKSCRQSAEAIAEFFGIKTKQMEQLRNLNEGLWQGKLIDDVRQKQPKVFKQWQEHPETVCPPEGETLATARQRVEAVLAKLLKKHKTSVIALVVPEPLTSLARSCLKHTKLGNLWQAQCECGSWELVEVEQEVAVHS